MNFTFNKLKTKLKTKNLAIKIVVYNSCGDDFADMALMNFRLYLKTEKCKLIEELFCMAQLLIAV